ncbi:MAG: tRNA pseudouridine(55) synthase TruB [Clostridiales bacterium]|nr:tRNA pseudouridine(55) synthase TruB [Clostridiales bacterium]MCF8022183.1 tRNA pseudouridine(55) synthase TruB [Clostridiales bacterium]
MDGVLNILKPPGMTSHDVVNFVRKLTGKKKVGHTGTLDPGAAGVLPVCIGKATKIIQYMSHDKEYRAEMTLGQTTTTQDSFGLVTEVKDCSTLKVEQVDRILKEFTGNIEQIPPMTSAVKHKGKKLYEIARAGEEVERKVRRVSVHELLIIDSFDTGLPLPKFIINIKCSAGTYVRTICSDIGKRLGLCAHMSFLLRTSAGYFDIDNTYTLEELKELQESSKLRNALISINNTLNDLCCVEVRENLVNAVHNGNRVVLQVDKINKNEIEKDNYIKLNFYNKTLAIGKTAGKVSGSENTYYFQPVKVLE